MDSIPVVNGATVAGIEKEVLGEGVHGRVSLVHWNNSPLVVKESKHPGNENFFREVPYLQALKGAGGAPEVVAVSNSPLAIVATFRGRKTLLDHLLSGALSDHSILQIALRLAQRLQEVHAARVIHNDLKADNIMVQESEEFQDGFEVFIIDFGLASFLGKSLKSRFTVGHMAPEVKLGKASFPKSDVFSLGVLFRGMKECFRDGRVYNAMEKISREATERNLKKRSSLKAVMEALKKAIAKTECDLLQPPAPGPSHAVSQQCCVPASSTSSQPCCVPAPSTSS